MDLVPDLPNISSKFPVLLPFNAVANVPHLIVPHLCVCIAGKGAA